MPPQNNHFASLWGILHKIVKSPCTFNVRRNKLSTNMVHCDFGRLSQVYSPYKYMKLRTKV